MPDIRIVPANAIMSFTSSLNFIQKITQDVSGSLNLYGSGSTGRTEILSVDGNNGRLFTVSDDLSDSLFSVNTIAGLPVIEAFADNTVKMGQYGQNVLVVTGSSIGIGKSNPGAFRLDAKGSGSLGVLKMQKGPTGYLMQGLDGDGYTLVDMYGNLADSNMQISLGDVGGVYSQPKFNINSTNIQFSSTNVGINATPSSNKLAVGGTVGLQASALGSAATQILVTSADPSSTTRTVQTRTPAEIRSDIGAGTVSSIATNNGVTGGTITSTGTIGLATAYGDTVNPYASKTANYFLAAPNGSAGVPSFRAIVAADIPTLNQSTTGNAGSVTYSPNRNDAAAYPVLWGAAYTNGIGTIAYSAAAVTIQSSTGTLSATNLAATTQITAPIFYETGTTSYYVDPASTSRLYQLEVFDKVQVGVGSAGTPTFTFWNDTNTGMYNVGADSVGFATAGVKRLEITAAGAMGLGITPTNTSGRFEATNDIVAYSSSDKNWKKNIKNIDSSLEKLSQINGVEFDWIEDEPLHGNKGHDVGVIAQEVELVIPEAVQTRESGMKAVQYDKIIPLLIEAIKELQKEIKELKK